jgi:hypothetical protein
MKTGFSFVAAAAMSLFTTACGSMSPGREATPGAYSAVPVTDAQVVSAAAFAVDAKRKAMLAEGDRATLDLVSIVRAEQQVVSGVNYRLELRVRRDGKEQNALAVVWWQAWRTPDPYRLTSWEWK